jgi:hypothetical protein
MASVHKCAGAAAVIGQYGKASGRQAGILDTRRFPGNATTHEVASAIPRELVAALEIAENILRTIYVLRKLSKQVTIGRKP